MKFSFCSEVFSTPIEETISQIAEIGFDGIEIAPFNMAESVDDISAQRRREVRKHAESCGIEVVGLHWLLVSPKGLHITTPDDNIRKRSWEYVKSLVRFCADLGGKIMVLGSPEQRNLVAGDSLDEAMKRFADGLHEITRVCAETRVQFLLEPLRPEMTNVLDSIESAVDLAKTVDHPQIGYILDNFAISVMADGILGSLEKYGQGTGHFHVNEPSGLAPGMGDFDFRPVLQKLKEVHFLKWVSCEPFNYEPDARTVAKTALKTLREAAEN